MNKSKINLIDIFKVLIKRAKFIAVFTLIVVVLGYVFAKLQDKMYASKSVSIVRSMAVLDRSHVFRKLDFQVENYFASENDIDHAITILEGDALINHLNAKFDLKNRYNVRSDEKAKKILKKNFRFKRNATKSIEISIQDKNPEFAQQYTLEATDQLERILKDYFLETQKEMSLVLQEKITHIDQMLRGLEDSILLIRKEYNLYDQMLPTRNEQVIVAQRSSTSSAEGAERIQKFTAQKDRAIKDRNEYFTMLNENSLVASSPSVQLLYRVESPSVPSDPAWPKTIYILVVSLIAGLIFSSLLSLLLESLHHVKAQAND